MKRDALGRVGAMVALTGLCVAAQQTSADVEFAYYVNEGIWGFSISGMTDLDQVRNGLPGNGGMYCVPTASMNMFAYAANHGFPEMFPGPGYWQATSGPIYDEMTDNIQLIGAIMGTDPQDGTGGTGWEFGVQAVTGLTGKFDVINKWSGGTYSPSVREMTQQVVLGGIVSFAYGRYDIIDTIGGVPVLDRRGGHVVTLQQALANSPTSGVMWYRDPADGGSGATQSPYGSREMPFAKGQYRLDWQDDKVLNMDRMIINPAPSDGRPRIIDQYIAIRPKSGYAFQPSNNFLSIILANIDGFFIGETFDINLDVLGGQMIDGLVNAEQTGVYVLIDPDGGGVEQLHELLPLEEEPRLIGELLRADHLTISPMGPVYAASGIALMCIDPDAIEPETVQIPIPLAPCDIDFDMVNHQVVMLSPAGVLLTTDADLQGSINMIPIPDGVPINELSSMSIDPSDGTIWVITPGEDSMYGLTPVVGAPLQVEELAFEEIVRPQSISVDDKGTLFVNTMDGLFCVTQGKDGAWEVKPDELFGDLPVGAKFTASRSVTNFDPENHVGLDFRHLFPDELLKIGLFVPECPGDVVIDSVVDLADLNRVLGTFGTDVEPLTAGDANGDGTVDLEDLNMVLANFGTECDV